jgi:hypothetical protein
MCRDKQACLSGPSGCWGRRELDIGVEVFELRLVAQVRQLFGKLQYTWHKHFGHVWQTRHMLAWH